MGISTVTRVLAVCLLCIGLAMSTGCGGDNGSDEVVLVPDSTIQGNVAQVVAALQAPRAQPTYWARWQEFFRLVPTVQAQQTGNLAGIVVVASQGTLLATTTTDATGNFILRVASGAATLTFTTATFTVSTNLSIPANSSVVLVFILQPTQVPQVLVSPQVVVAEGLLTLSPIRCTGGTAQLPAGLPPGDIKIDGGGEDCLRAEGQCTIDLQLGARSLILTNCERCIRAAGNADVRLLTIPETATDKNPISCTASEDGILAQGTASITLETAKLDITAGEHGVHASGNAEVVLKVPVPDCTITGSEGLTRIDGNATIDGCGVPPAEVALSPIRCTGGTVQLPDGLPPGDIKIDGGGEDCLRAEGQCTIDLQLGARSLILTNCERCIRAAGNADVRLLTIPETATDKNPISCTASEDGILAQGTASITLETAKLDITAGEHGVHASGNAEVVLTVPDCTITGSEGPTRIDGNATIDGCGVPPAEVALSPIRCTGGTVQLPDGLPPGDIKIDGGGEDCLRAEGQCTIDLQLGARSLILTNCERCIRAAGNADVRLLTIPETATDKNPISCTASEDGILAQGTASITLETAKLDITAGEHGVHASGNAEVVLTVPVPDCAITGDEGRVRIDGNATIDDCGF